LKNPCVITGFLLYNYCNKSQVNLVKLSVFSSVLQKTYLEVDS